MQTYAQTWALRITQHDVVESTVGILKKIRYDSLDFGVLNYEYFSLNFEIITANSSRELWTPAFEAVDLSSESCCSTAKVGSPGGSSFRPLLAQKGPDRFGPESPPDLLPSCRMCHQ